MSRLRAILHFALSTQGPRKKKRQQQLNSLGGNEIKVGIIRSIATRSLCSARRNKRHPESCVRLSVRDDRQRGRERSQSQSVFSPPHRLFQTHRERATFLARKHCVALDATQIYTQLYIHIQHKVSRSSAIFARRRKKNINLARIRDCSSARFSKESASLQLQCAIIIITRQACVRVSDLGQIVARAYAYNIREIAEGRTHARVCVRREEKGDARFFWNGETCRSA